MHTHQHVLDALRLEASGVPIYVQLRDQILRLIATGVLGAGDQMPTMRQVAVTLRIDLNTVRHAYDELERRGAVQLVRGRGSFVTNAGILAEPPADPSPLDQLARQTLAAATALGLDPSALCKRIAALAADLEDLR